MPLPHRMRGATRNPQCAAASAAKPRTCPRRAVSPGHRTRQSGKWACPFARLFSWLILFAMFFFIRERTTAPADSLRPGKARCAASLVGGAAVACVVGRAQLDTGGRGVRRIDSVCMKLHKILLLAVACTWAMGASAQWQWIDKEGRKVFSDRSPPQDIPEKDILKRPGSRSAPAAKQAVQSVAAAPATAASKPAVSGKDKELEEKKAQADAAEAAKKKAAEEKVAKDKAENCTRARAAKAAFDAGKPITQANADGERIFLDGPARDAEARRINEIVASDCVK